MNSNSIRTFLTLVFLFFSLLALAQNEEGSWAEGATEEEIKAGERQPENAQKEEQVEADEKPAWREKVFFGAGGGLQFSSFGTFIGLMPSVGYRLTPKFHAGVIGIYQFVRYRNLQQSVHNYGASLFARYFIIPQLYATAEYEQISYDISYRTGQESRRQWVDRPLLGAGYFSPGRNGGGVYFGILYDVNFSRSINYPYDSPFVYRVGFIF